MGDKQQPAHVELGGRGAGGCVAVTLVGVPLAALFAASPDVGVMGVWVGGGAAVWWAVRRRAVSDSSATPPPDSGPPSGDVYADESDEIDRVERGPEGVVCIVHPKRVEINQP